VFPADGQTIVPDRLRDTGGYNDDQFRIFCSCTVESQSEAILSAEDDILIRKPRHKDLRNDVRLRFVHHRMEHGKCLMGAAFGSMNYRYCPGNKTGDGKGTREGAPGHP
jgi:hypothetical protein